MRILIVGINYAPELTGIGKYSSEMAEWLVAAGHEVRMVTAPPYYPEWKVATNYSAWRYCTENRGGVSIWRCPLWVPAKPSGLKRLLHLASFSLSSLPVMLRQIFWRPDVILTVEPPLFCAPIAWICARLSGAKAWLHIQDFEVDAAFELGILRAQKLRWVVGYIESWLMRRFDRVSSISSNMAQRLIQKGVSADKVALFTNWVDVDAIFPLDRPSVIRQELGVTVQQMVVLYAGNMGEKQGLEIVLEAAAKLGIDENILFVLCGEGAARQRLQQRYANLRNVKWLPLQPLDRLNELLNLADLHLLPQRAGAEDLVMPSKLTGMLASGRPVIATVNKGTQVAQVLVDCGLVVPPDDIAGFKYAIQHLAGDASLRRIMSLRAREFAVRHWSKMEVMNEFSRQLKEFECHIVRT